MTDKNKSGINLIQSNGQDVPSILHFKANYVELNYSESYNLFI